MGLYEDYEALDKWLEEGICPDSDDVGEDDYLAYLNRGERLINTLREHNKRNLRFTTDEFLEMFSLEKFVSAGKSYGKCRYIRSRVKSYLRKALTTPYDSEGRLDKSRVEEFFRKIPGVTVLDENNDDALHMAAQTCAGTEALMPFTIDSIKYYGILPVTKELSDRRNLVPYHWVRYPAREYAFANLVNSFSKAVLVEELRKRVQHELSLLNDTNREDNILYVLLKEESEKTMRCYADLGCISVSDKITIPQHFRIWAEKNGVSVDTVNGSGLKKLSSERSYAFGLSWLMYGTGEEAWSRSLHEFAPASLSDELIISVLKYFLDNYCQRKEENRYISHMSKEHARSFQNLKDIPEKYARAMAGSKFGEWFGYVEYDPDVILKGNEVGFEVLGPDGKVASTETIVSEWQAFVKTFGLKPHEDVSLRFRKLGNHHASGLYYPVLKCMCIDIRTPSSFWHEYCHMLDYENGNVSLGYAFEECREKYCQILKDKVKDDKALKEQLKGKYDMSYFTQATEVFARCGEMYVSRLCGITNCLIRHEQANDFAYPDDETLNGLIGGFFDKFLGISHAEIYNSLHAADAVSA